jgi:hypothetical protein
MRDGKSNGTRGPGRPSVNGQVKCSGRHAFSLFLVLLLSSALAPRSAQAQTVTVGVNVVGVDLASRQTKDDLLAQLQRYGVNTVRTSLGGHGEGYTDFIIEAHQRGIGAVIFIGPEAGSTNNAHALPPDKAAGRPWGIGALSDADPEGFKKWFGDELAKLEAAGVRATAFELGNELNTPRFNADFGPDKIPGRVLGLKDLENLNDSEARAVADGYRQYIKIMAVLKDVRDHSKLNRTTPILSGMSAIMAKGREVAPIPDSMQFLRQNGLDKLADGYAVHVYPDGNPRLTVATRAQQLEQYGILSECRKDTKPCWLTEWGFPNGSTGCPLDDTGRAQDVQAERAAFKQYIAQGRLKAIVYYSWSGVVPFNWEPADKINNDPYNIFRCDVLSNSGKAALAPL